MDLNTNIISKAHVINMGNTCNCSIDNKQQIVNFGTDVETLYFIIICTDVTKMGI